MDSLYREDIAYIQAAGFGEPARRAAPEIVRRLKNAAIPVRRVVDAGCGAGPLTAALVAGGFEVTGIDPSSELLKIARRAAPAASFVHGSVYDAELPPCEGVIALGEALTYHSEPDKADRLVADLFRRIAGILPAGGLLIFDVIEPGEPSLAGRFWASGEDWAVLAETTENPTARVLLRDIQTFRRMGTLYRRGREVHNVRLFDARTLCDQLAACGFATETAKSYGAQTLGPRRRAFFATRTGT